jgi:hypothetical protein
VIGLESGQEFCLGTRPADESRASPGFQTAVTYGVRLRVQGHVDFQASEGLFSREAGNHDAQGPRLGARTLKERREVTNRTPMTSRAPVPSESLSTSNKKARSAGLNEARRTGLEPATTGSISQLWLFGAPPSKGQNRRC